MKVNSNARGNYNVNSQIEFKTAMLKSNLCDYRDAYIAVKELITLQEPEQMQQHKEQVRITGRAPAAGNKTGVEIAILLKYLSSFWETLK